MAFVSPFTREFTRTTALIAREVSTVNRRPKVPKMVLKADLDHIALDCHDSANQHAFYRHILQFEHMQMPHAPFPSVRVSDITILDFMKSDKSQGLEAANHICFNVSKDAMDQLKDPLSDAGIVVGEPKLRGGARGRGWSV